MFTTWGGNFANAYSGSASAAQHS
ncbi:hypothetical protein SBA2_770008 [Acidobacteriia bacterium SbA2]|nr:hypothetical protein SBA2_770008 [Acidobacteriia bacterium SbA2]